MASRTRWRVAVTALLIGASAAAGGIADPAPAVAAPGPPDAPQWWFDAWHVPQLWAEGADGRGMTVAIVDTGVQANVPELSGKVLAGADLIGNGTDGRTDFDTDGFSHGTAMASLIVASHGYADIEGIAPAAKVLPIAVPLNGVLRTGTPIPNATSVAVRYAVDHGAKIISMSLGGLVYEGEEEVPCPAELQNAITYAVGKGALVVAASGNSGSSGSPVEEPGVCLGTISVGAVDAQENATSFSSRHPYLDVTAPGQNIATLSKVTGEAYIGGGTSQATAITAGALAMIWSKYPSETNLQIASRLLDSAVDRGPRGRDSTYGLGVIDPSAAIANPRLASQPNVVFTGVQPLLAQAGAKAGSPAPKSAAGDSHASLGSFDVGSSATPLGLEFFALLGAAVACLAVAIVLWVATARPSSAVGRLLGRTRQT